MSRQCPNCSNPIPEESPQAICTACLLKSDSGDEETAPPSTRQGMLHGQFHPGDILDERYRIVSLLGKGGMGEVYRVDDLKLKLPVALKMLPQELAGDRPRLEALYNEVRRARMVSHPNVCRVHDIGEISGSSYLTMEYIDGEDLGSLLRRIGRLPPDKFVILARQLCEGVQAGHDQGVLHLDLKPANVMIDRKGNLRIADFGLSCLAAEAADRQHIAGTPAYMAPEQFSGGQASAQSDLYAIGLILTETFTGRRALSARSVDEIRAFHQQGGQVKLPSELKELLDDCLAPSPASRPKSVAALLPLLETIQPDVQEEDAPSQKQLAALLFTDIVGSVALQQRLGTEAYMRFVACHDEVFQQCLSKTPDARVLNETGDGFLVQFSDPSDAVNAALHLQHTLSTTETEGEKIRIRIGLHLGVVTEMQERIRGEKRAVGMPINLTARIMDLAEAGQILMTRSVYEDARNFVRLHPAADDASDSLTLTWASHGLFEFKGNPEPIEIFEVGVEGVAPLVAPEASGKASRVREETSTSITSTNSETQPVEVLDESAVFLGYSPIDDQALQPAAEGWISQFHRNLEIRLQQLAGEPLRVWRGHWDPNDDDSADEGVVERLPSMRAMVSVVSPPFVKSARCQKEVSAFLKADEPNNAPAPERSARMVKALKRPVPTSDMNPLLDQSLSDRAGIEFFDRDPDTGRVREFDEAFGDRARQRYQERIYDLAHEVNSVLQNVADVATGEKGKRIFLAMTTYELQDAYDTIRRVLLDKGHTVQPDRPLPMEATALEHDVRSCLQECDLAIHLLGSNYGMIPENAHQSASEIQNRIADEEARSQSFPRLLWMPREVDPQDERQAAFLKRIQEEDLQDEAVDLVKGTVSLFKEVLMSRLAPEPEPEEEPSEAKETTAAQCVYIMCDREDESAIEPLEDYLFEKGLEVLLPDFEADSDEFGQNHRSNLTDCDAVLIYYGKGRKAWVDTKLRDALKATGYGRKSPIRHQAVYVAPPEDARKARYKTHNATVIRQTGETCAGNPELDAFIETVTGGTHHG